MAGRPGMSGASSDPVSGAKCSSEQGSDKRPELINRRAKGVAFANANTSSRNNFSMGDFGVMKLVERDELRMFSVDP